MRNHFIVEKLTAYTEKLLQYCDGLHLEAFIWSPQSNRL